MALRMPIVGIRALSSKGQWLANGSELEAKTGTLCLVIAPPTTQKQALQLGTHPT
jgi:hypothetical protein